MPIEYNSNGKPYFRGVHDEAGTDFHPWLTREIYRAFRGVVPDGYEAFHVNGNRANLKPSNLEIRPRSRVKSRFRLPTAPREVASPRPLEYPPSYQPRSGAGSPPEPFRGAACYASPNHDALGVQ